MAFDYAKHHSRSLYNSNGVPYPCHSVDDEKRAREAGFTSVNYVLSRWPTTVYNKKTGESKTVGRLDWSNEKNEMEITNLGPDWAGDYVAPVEPKKEATPAEGAGGLSLMALAEVLTEIRGLGANLKQVQESLLDVEIAVADLTSARVAMESRLSEMEAVIVEPVAVGHDEKPKKK